jgi:hypothetical protein
MQRRYTTDTAEGVGVEPTRPCGSRAFQARPVTKSGSPSVSSPGWNRTTDLLRVGEAPWPLDHGTVSTPARSRTRTSSFEARRDVRFTTRAISGRRGIRTLTGVFQPAGLADQPCEPYQATFRSVETVGIEPTPVCLQGSLAALGTCVPNFGQQLRRPDSNRRRTAYETVLEPILQSTPQ